MWLLTVLLQGEATPVTLQFREQRHAQDAYQLTLPSDLRSADPDAAPQHGFPGNDTVEISDDFGRTLSYARHLFARALLASLDRAMAGDQEVNLAVMVANATLQLNASRHPAIKELQRETSRPQQPFGIATNMAGGMTPVRIG